MKKILLLACFLIIGVVAHAQDCYETLLEKGKTEYTNGNFDAAIKKWQVALKCEDISYSQQQNLNNLIANAKNPPTTTISHQSYEPEMVTVNGGTFQMGDVMGDNEYPDEKPVHSVTLNSFQIGKYEVSQAEWVAVMGSNPSYFKGDNLPVEQVSWEDVQIYLEKLNSKTGKSYRLPTEAEWEYAAREGGKNRRFGNGKNTIDPSEINFNASADYKKSYSNTGTYRAKTVAVSSFSPNALGLYNMSGNVWEWCSDWYEKIITKTVPHLIRKARLRGLFAWFAAAAGTAIRRTAVPRIATPARLRTAATAWVSVWRPPFSETVCLSGFDLNFRNFGIAGIM